MKVLVINEPFVPDFCRTQRWAARTRGRVLRPPDWLAYATAVLEEAGIDVELYDFPARKWDKAELRTLIREKQPRYLVLDSTTPSIYSDLECARIGKEEAGSYVIMVGPHASALPGETLDLAEGAVDAVARGEYDYTVRDIVIGREEKSDLSRLLGVSYREGGRVRHNEDRPLITDLDALPFPAWHQLEMLKYFDGGKLYPYFDLISGRGCPYRCSFCLWPQVMHGRRYRLRSAGNVVDEMALDLAEWPKLRRGEIFFEDDTFTVNPARAAAVCDELLNRKVEVTWSLNARADTGDLGLFKKMKSAGCRELLVGFESGDQEVLDRMGKGITLNQGRDFVAAAHKAGLVVHGCFVIGLPGETLASIERTLNYARELKLDTIQFSAAIPFPGTDYYDYCREKDLIKAKKWDDWLEDGEQSTVIEYPGLTKEQITHYVDKGLKDFYFRPGFMLKFLFSTKSFSDLYRKVRGARNFLAYLFPNAGFDAVLIAIHTLGGLCLLLLVLPGIYAGLLKLRARGAVAPAARGYAPPVTVIVPAHNEEGNISGKIEALLGQNYPPENVAVVVVDDGSTDGTASRLGKFSGRVRVLSLNPGEGKIAALNLALGEARTEIVAITDADTGIESNSLRNLISPFQDRSVGAVSGRLSVRGEGKSAAYESAYVEAEHGFRAGESAVSSVPFLFGQLSAFRRESMPRIQSSSAVDDIEIALTIKESGLRVIYSDSASVYETAPASLSALLGQKTRRGACTIEVVFRHLGLLRPRHGFFALTFFVRRVLPLFLPLILAAVFAYLVFLARGWAIPAAAFMLLWGIAWLRNRNLTEYMTLMQISVCKSWWLYFNRAIPIGANWKSSRPGSTLNSTTR